MIDKFLKILFIFFFIQTNLSANTKYFEDGLNLFTNKKFEEAKFKFEQDIVFNPKNEMSYLYLSKIFKNLEKKRFGGGKLKNCNLIKSSERGSYLLFSETEARLLGL